MNTYELKDEATFLALPEYARTVILDALREPEADYISIQLQDVHSSDESWTELYGIYFKTAKEVSDYDNNGGLWMYYHCASMLILLGLTGE